MSDFFGAVTSVVSSPFRYSLPKSSSDSRSASKKHSNVAAEGVGAAAKPAGGCENHKEAGAGSSPLHFDGAVQGMLALLGLMVIGAFALDQSISGTH